MKSIYDLLALKLKLKGIFQMEHTYYKMQWRQLKHKNTSKLYWEAVRTQALTFILKSIVIPTMKLTGMASFFTFAAPRTQVTDSEGGSSITTERPVQKRPL